MPRCLRNMRSVSQVNLLACIYWMKLFSRYRKVSLRYLTLIFPSLYPRLGTPITYRDEKMSQLSLPTLSPPLLSSMQGGTSLYYNIMVMRSGYSYATCIPCSSIREGLIIVISLITPTIKSDLSGFNHLFLPFMQKYF